MWNPRPRTVVAVVGHAEARRFEVNTQAVPGVSRNLSIDSVTSLAANDVERTADTVDGLVKHDIILQRVGPGHIVILRVFRSPDNAGCTILGAGNGLEFDLNEAILDAGVVLQKQRIGGSA